MMVRNLVVGVMIIWGCLMTVHIITIIIIMGVCIDRCMCHTCV